ncbi:MAG TPA: outer membrane beta-barrel protein [Myxococcales bacterium]|jgi:hypothetical protein
MRSLFAVVLLVAAPAFAQGYSRPYSEWDRRPLEGIYLGIAGGGQLMIASDDQGFSDNAFGYDGELRLGYSFGVPFALYASASFDGANFGNGFSDAFLRTEMFAVFLQYHLYARPDLMVYVRGGLGVGVSADVTFDGSSAAGIAGQGGLGFEFRVAQRLYLAPEFFYKNMNLNGGSGGGADVQMLGVQLGLIYY